MPENTVEIVIKGGQWDSLPRCEEVCRQAIERALLCNEVLGVEVVLLLTSSETMRDLNHQFRGKDKETNILSFPSDESESLGDLAIGWEIIEREAMEQGKRLEDHLMHMLVHGVMHLLGYDHDNDDDANIMELKEIKILQDLNIKNPYK